MSPRSKVLVALLGTIASFGCGPQGPLGVIPGGPLAGDVVAEAVGDWEFTDDDVTVAIETNGGWFNHSVTVLAAAHDGLLYVPSRQGYRKDWVKNVLEDPHVRVGVDGRIYPGKATRVLDSDEAGRVAGAMLKKYLGLEPERPTMLLEPPSEGDDRTEVWLFRIESMGAAQ